MCHPDFSRYLLALDSRVLYYTLLLLYFVIVLTVREYKCMHIDMYMNINENLSKCKGYSQCLSGWLLT